MSDRANVVLVHGAWAEGSCWNGVIERLQGGGFEVRAAQFPLCSLADDVARLRQVLEFRGRRADREGSSVKLTVNGAEVEIDDRHAKTRRPRGIRTRLRDH